MVNDWSTLPEQVNRYYAAARPVAEALQRKLAELPVMSEIAVLFDPERPRVVACFDKTATTDEIAGVLDMCRLALPDLEVERRSTGSRPWRVDGSSLIKVGEPNNFRRAGEIMQFFPGKILGMPNAQSSVAATLAGGALGAGLGYGAGWLGERVMPESWNKGRLRKTLALLGGAAGMTPGLAWAYAQRANGQPTTGGWPLDTPAYSDLAKDNLTYAGQAYKGASLHELHDQHLTKVADRTGAGGVDLAVNVDEFNRVIWNDGRVANRLNPETKGLASGILTAAQAIPGGHSGWVTPAQMGRIAAGMGVGYLSGALVGGALGALTGMPPQAQERLKQTGMYAGLVEVVLPKLFGL